MKWILATASIVIALTLEQATMAHEPSSPAAAEHRVSEKDWRLVWSDEFDTEGRPDPRNWNYETGFVRNQELQWYQPENARCHGGRLIIEARRERQQNPRYEPNSADWRTNREHADYTSAC